MNWADKFLTQKQKETREKLKLFKQRIKEEITDKNKRFKNLKNMNDNNKTETLEDAMLITFSNNMFYYKIDNEYEDEIDNATIEKIKNIYKEVIAM